MELAEISKLMIVNIPSSNTPSSSQINLNTVEPGYDDIG
jgi:hypothetical protein